MEKDKHPGASSFSLGEKNLTSFWKGGNHLEKEKNISLLEARRPWNNSLKIVMTVILKLQFCTLPNWQTDVSTDV